MIMTAGEIVTRYRQAKDKKGQIKILSQLNACPSEEIKQVLVENGMEMSDLPVLRKKWTVQEEDRLRQLAAEGLTCEQIGKEVKRTEKAVREKAERMHVWLGAPVKTISAQEMADEPHGWVEEEPPELEKKLQASLEHAAAEQAKKILEEAEAMNKEIEIPELRDIPIRPLSLVEAQLVLTHDKMQEMLCRAVGTELQAGREALLVDMLAALGFEVLQYFSKGETHGRVDAGDQ